MDLQQVWDALKTVIDPEIHSNIVDMGLVYSVVETNGVVAVDMTLTTPGCPLSNELKQQAQAAAESVEGVKGAEVTLVWDPRWSPIMMTPEARKKMGV